MKNYTLMIALLLTVFVGHSQQDVDFDANATFLGYANVFETPANGGGFVFGEAWGVEDLKTEVNASEGTVTLKPNFNTWNPADPFWVTGSGEANKVFEGNTYVEDNSLVGSSFTFNGNCATFTLDSGYAVKAFIRVFNADFSVVKEVNTVLTAGQNFSVTYDDVEPADATVQYGFAVTGLVADPADEATLGSVVVRAPQLSVQDSSLVKLNIVPNPMQNIAQINSTSELQNITIYNIAGQQVVAKSLSGLQYGLDVSALSAGIYFANVNTVNGTQIIKLIKK